METVVKAFLYSAMAWPVGGWALMLILGILHHDASGLIPAFGFWLCLALVALASCVKSAVAPSVGEEK